MENDNINFDPEASLGALQQPYDYVTMFSASRAFRDAQKAGFLSGELISPDLTTHTKLAANEINPSYFDESLPRQDISEHGLRRRAYSDLTRVESYLRTKIEQGTQNIEDNHMLQWISAQKSRLAFLQAAEARVRENGAADFLSEEELTEFMRKWSVEFWGKPELEEARHLAATVLPEAIPALNNSIANSAIAHYLEVMEGAGIKEKKEEVLPTKEALAHYHEILKEMLQPTIDYVFDGVEDTEFREEEAKLLFERALKNLGLSANGWEVEVDLDKNNMATDNFKKKIYIGKRNNPYTRMDIERLTVHEIFIHAMRSMNGEKRGSFLLQYGMAGYLPFEEGLTTYSEFAWTGKVANVTHKRRFMVISYAQGLFDGKFHDFKETYPFVLGFSLLEAMSKEEMTSDEINRISSVVYDETLRAFRGMDPELKGVNDMALGSYYSGFLKVVELMDPNQSGNYLNVQQFRELLVGKYDATNPEQKGYASQVPNSVDSKEWDTY